MSPASLNFKLNIKPWQRLSILSVNINHGITFY